MTFARTLLSAAALLLLAACSPSEKPKDASASSAPADSTGVYPYPRTDYITQGQGRPGGTLRVSVAADPLILDNQVTLSGQWWGRLIADFLVYLDENGEPGPYLAKSWDISPDGLTYTFHLREGVTFSDGEKFNAEAVRANFDRIRDPKTQGALSTALLEPVAATEVLDDYTLRVRLHYPHSAFPSVLATTWTAIYSPRSFREDPKGILQKPVGTGPFVVESYTANQNAVFVKRADYNWAPPLIKHTGPAYLDRIIVDFVPEPLIRYTSVTSGAHDLTIGLAPQNAAAVRADPSLAFANRVHTGNPMRGPIFNTEKAPFDDVRVRKAFALAVDREGIGQIMGFGEYRLKSDFLSSNNRYYDPSFKDVLAFNPAEANRLLEEAGWTGRDAAGFRTKDGQRLSALVYLNQNETTQTLVSIQAEVKKIGVELTLEQVPSAQRLALVNENRYQAMRPSFAYNGNSADGLNNHYHSRQINTGLFVGQNASRTRDTVLDDLLDQGRRTRDHAELKAIYSRVQKRLVELVPAVPLYEFQTLYAYKTYVKGVLYDTSNDNLAFTTVWLDR